MKRKKRSKKVATISKVNNILIGSKCKVISDDDDD
jgi:hypothetical protein